MFAVNSGTSRFNFKGQLMKLMLRASLAKMLAEVATISMFTSNLAQEHISAEKSRL